MVHFRDRVRKDGAPTPESPAVPDSDVSHARPFPPECMPQGVLGNGVGTRHGP